MKRLVLLFSACMLLSMANADTHLKLIDQDGSEQSLLLSLVGKLKFVDEWLVLYSTDGEELARQEFKKVCRIVFAEPSATDLSNVDMPQVNVYPNPTQDRLIVKGIETDKVRVYSLKGELLLTTAVENGEAQVDVSNLQNGTYLLQIATQAVKFIKE